MLKFVLTLFLVTVTVVMSTHFALVKQPSFLYQTSLFLFFTTVIIYGYLYRLKNPQVFVQLYLAIMALKLLVYGGYIFAIVFINRPEALRNIAYFLVIYILFTAIEVGFLYRKIKGKA